MKQSNSESYSFPQRWPDASDRPRDVLTEILRQGAQNMLGQAVWDEVARYLGERADLVDDQGHQLIVRNGYLPKREVMTGIGRDPTAPGP
jgi:hypothetical protein